MAEYYLAVDIGASSGRHILGHLEDGRIVLEEVYRFENGMEKKDGHLCWNLPRLFHEIKEGLKACRAAGKIPKSMGIDTWAVDYVLLDGEDRILGNTYGYRDGRTKGMDKEVYKIIPEDALYARTGIQKQLFNTIYQLMAVKTQEPENMEKAEWLLMLPDYFHFLLTGNKLSEYTNATSTQLVSPETKQWDYELIERLGYKPSVFRPLHMPGTVVGPFSKEVEEEVGFTCEVVMPATHDTASAVISVPALTDDCLYISSGTWSLMGIENDKAICSPESRERNFTNEGGYEYRFRYLKNIMEAIKAYCRKHGWREPETTGQIAAVIYQSLAESYAETVREIEALTGRTFPAINIVGGGSNAAYLNQLTADKSGRCVYAGPGEATAIGNLAVQMLKDGKFEGLAQVRACIYDSFGVKKYEAR